MFKHIIYRTFLDEANRKEGKARREKKRSKKRKGNEVLPDKGLEKWFKEKMKKKCMNAKKETVEKTRFQFK